MLIAAVVAALRWRAGRIEQIRAAEPPPPPPRATPPPADPADALRSTAIQRLHHVQSDWLVRCQACPQCGHAPLGRTEANYQSHSTRGGGFATKDVTRHCEACGWTTTRHVLDHVSPARARPDAASGPPLRWQLADVHGAPLGELVSGDGRARITAGDGPVVDLARELVDSVVAMDLSAVSPEVAAAIRRDAVGRNLLFGATASLVDLEHEPG